MPKDLKIGMIIGVVLLIAATLVISFLSKGSIESRLEGKFNKDSTEKTPVDNGAGEVTNSGKSDDDNRSEIAAAPPADKPAENTDRIHIVTAGQTLNDIAEKYYGNRLMINKIVDANPTIPDSYELKPGMKLKVPE